MEPRKPVFHYVSEFFNDDFIPSGFWEEKYTPPSEVRKREIVNAKSSAVTQFAQGIAQDVEFVEVLTTPDLRSTPPWKGGECCSGHECFFKRTGVRCITCKNQNNG